MTHTRLNRRAALLALATAATVTAVPGVAYAYWTASAVEPGAAVAATLQGGNTPSASATGSNVALTFARASTASGAPITSYLVRRYATASSGTAAGSFTCSWPTGTSLSCNESNVADGSWYYTTTPQLAGTSWTGAESSRGDVAVDTTAPAVAITSPHGGAATSATPAFSGTAGTASGDSSTVTVKVYAGGDTTGSLKQTLTAPVGSGGGWSANASNALATGTYTVQATQTDAAGNTGRSSAVTFTVDASAPTVAINSPANNATTSATPTIAGTAGTAAGDDGTVAVKIYSGSSASGSPVQSFNPSVGSGGNWSVTANTLASGTYTVVASQGDSFGNTATSAPVTFTVATVPAPTVTVTAPNGPVNTTTPVLKGTASATGGQVTVKVYAGTSAGGSPTQTLSASPAGDGTWQVTPPPALPANASYTVVASQANAGGTGTSNPVTFVIDTTAPANVAVTSPTGGAQNVARAVTFSGTAGTAAASSSSTADAATVTVKVYAGSAATGTPTNTLTATVGANGQWSVSVPANSKLAANATYMVTATQVDAVANSTTSAPVTFKTGQN